MKLVSTSRSTSSVLVSAVGFAGVFVLAAACLWAVYETNLVPITYIALYWYAAITTIAMLVAVGAAWCTDTTYQRYIPRIYLLTAFLAWISVHIGTAVHTDVLAVYYLHLLEAPLLFLLLALVAGRIVTTFSPGRAVTYVRGLSLGLGVCCIVLAPTTLNYVPILERGVVSFVPGLAYLTILLAGFAIFFLSVCLIPLGRPRYATTPRKSVGPLIFSESLQPEDVSVPQLLEHRVYQWRKVALKRGQWLRYRNYLTKHTGIIASEPKSFENALDALFAEALQRNTTHGLAVEIHEDTRHPYLHITIDYSGKAIAKTSLRSHAEHITELGGALTVNSDAAVINLVISFPVQW